MASSDLILVGSYDYRLVALSVLIAIMASYGALDLGARVTASRGAPRSAWLIGGATAMGIGIGSMHFMGMLAFRLPVPVQYDLPTVSLSLLAGTLASALALFVVSRPTMGSLRALSASVFMGGGIAAMHYIAMASMRLEAMCHYSPALVSLSVALAITISLGSLWLTFLSRDEATRPTSRKAASAMLMGTAITVMHYTGMAAASFTRSAAVLDASDAVNISVLGITSFSVVTFMVLEICLLTSLVDRLRNQRALYDELFEQAPEAITLMNVDNRIVRVNREFTRVFGYTAQETLGRRLEDLIVPDESREEVQRYMELVAHDQRVEAEGVRQRRDASRLHVSVIRVPVSIPGGQIAVYAIFRDVTERKRAEERLQHSLDQLRALAARLGSVREEERTRVAREIHDELGQALTAIKIDMASLIRELGTDRKQESEKAESILRLVDQTIQSVRRIATELRPGILDDLGLVAAVEWAAEEFQTRTGIRCMLDLPEDGLPVDPESATAIFRIFQETLTNVARHANAMQVDVRLSEEDGTIILEVRDNGLGINGDPPATSGSLGILGMRERALLLGGELTVSGSPGKGTTVKLRIPVGTSHRT